MSEPLRPCYGSGNVMEKWVLITGASEGIGRELAGVFAENGFNLVLVARNEGRLNELAAELRTAHSIQARVLPQDLSQADAAWEIFQKSRETPISVLVNNAGFGSYGRFVETEVALQTRMMQVNMTALVQLTHLFVQPMLARRSGCILNLASTAAFQPGPMINIYYATKAFVHSFSYALADELSGSGVTVTSLCPGMTRTEFQQRAHLHEGGLWPMMSARAVAVAGYQGLMKGKRVVIPGLLNRIGAFLAKRAPARLTSIVVHRIHQQ
jgi:short-subunit dehydrogenase